MYLCKLKFIEKLKEIYESVKTENKQNLIKANNEKLLSRILLSYYLLAITKNCTKKHK